MKCITLIHELNRDKKLPPTLCNQPCATFGIKALETSLSQVAIFALSLEKLIAAAVGHLIPGCSLDWNAANGIFEVAA